MPTYGIFNTLREVSLRVPSALLGLTSVFGIYKHALTWHVYAGNLAQERLGACVASGFP